MYTAAANLKTEPWPHQQEAIDFVRDKPGAMLAIEMGAGKSLCNIALMNELECQRTLIVCPLSIVDHVWPAQILTHSAREYRIVTLGDRVPGVKAKLKKAQEALASRRPTPVVVIINYDSAWREPLGSWLLSQSWDPWYGTRYTGSRAPQARPPDGRPSWLTVHHAGWAIPAPPCPTPRWTSTPSSGR